MKRVGTDCNRGKHRQGRRLQFEGLEAREMMAGPAHAVKDQATGVLTITADSNTAGAEVQVYNGQPGWVVVKGALGPAKKNLTPFTGVTQIVFKGAGGNDKFTNDTAVFCSALGGLGNDMLTGGSDRDVLDGGGGNDRLYGRGNINVLIGGWGNDKLYGGEGGDWMYGDLPNGGSGNDTLFGEGGSDAMAGCGGNDWLVGGQGLDMLSGNEGDDVLIGGDIRGGFGFNSDNVMDYLWGGLGKDTFVLRNQRFGSQGQVEAIEPVEDRACDAIFKYDGVVWAADAPGLDTTMLWPNFAP